MKKIGLNGQLQQQISEKVYDYQKEVRSFNLTDPLKSFRENEL